MVFKGVNMKESLVKNASEAFFSGDYENAIILYRKAEAVIGKRLFDANLTISENRLNGHKKIWIPSELEEIYSKQHLRKEKKIIHNELISIIIPSFNNGRWIEIAINSALSQQGVNVEIIVIDDGSTDNSIAVLKSISEKHDNVKVISLLKNFGCYYARNIGVVNSSGDYLTIIDSDDIMHPERILIQMNALKEYKNAVAVRGHQRRWNRDYTIPISELKPGENSLLWKKDVVKVVGYYDTVKYSADAEFRLRLQRTYGTDKVITLKDELYYTRALENSLTTHEDSKVFEIKGNELRVNWSPQRKRYFENFTNWQKSNKPSQLGKKGNMYTPFPQTIRKFELGSPEQNASPSLYQKVVGGIASFPPREESLKKVVDSILPQLDELYVYLNEYSKIPDFLKNKKIRVFTSQEEAGDLRDNGKFFNLLNIENAYVFTFDDDLLYPSDYVSKLIHYIEVLNRNCIVGVHGVIFPEEKLTALDQRTVFYFRKKHQGNFVDLLGTGTTAWHSSVFSPSLVDFKTKGVCDLHFAAQACRKNVPMFSVPREQNWLREIKRYEESLYQEALKKPDKFFNSYYKYLEPILEKNNVRQSFVRHMCSAYDKNVLQAAGIGLFDSDCGNKKHLKIIDNIHFHIIVNGWNCEDYVDKCIRSIAEQNFGHYTYEVSLIDDGSTDNTFNKINDTPLFPNSRVTRIKSNMGPAYARHLGISAVSDPETVVVLIDMDDAIDKNALKIVAEKYIYNKKCLMTIGNWIDQNGKTNPQEFYSAEQIDNQKIRNVELFNATHLRTFKKKLYNAVTEFDLKNDQDEWFQVCTDVALMYPLIDQCWSDEIEFITETIYKYTRQHSTGTLSRFGKPYKIDQLNCIKKRKPKVKLNKSI